jgi:hypothetical protein
MVTECCVLLVINGQGGHLRLFAYLERCHDKMNNSKTNKVENAEWEGRLLLK